MSRKGFAGTWKLNRAESDIPPVTKKAIMTIDADGIDISIRGEWSMTGMSFSSLPFRADLMAATTL